MSADAQGVSNQAAAVRRTLRRRGLFAAVLIGLAAVALLALVIAGQRFPQEQDRARRWEVHTYRVLLASRDVLVLLQRADLSEKGFLIGGRADYRARFALAADGLPKALARLADLTRDNPSQAARVEELSSAASNHLQRLRANMALAEAGRPDRALEVDRDVSAYQALADLRDTLQRLTDEENSLLSARALQVTHEAMRTRVTFYALSTIAGLVLLLSGVIVVLLNRASSRLALAEVEGRAAEERARARDFLQAVVDGAPDPIFVKDREGRFLVANQATARAIGSGSAPLIGVSDADFLSPEVAEPIRQNDLRILASGVPEIVEERLFDDGAWRTYLSSKAPWREAGEVVGIIGVARDITDRKQAEAALQTLNDELEIRVEQRTREIERAEAQIRQMQKMESIGQLTGGIAHDFNNMLAIVLGSLEIAVRNLESDPEKARRFMGNAQEGATRAAALTSRLLAFSRQQPLEPESLDANKLISGMADLLQRTLGERVQLETVLAGGLWRTLVDPGELENSLVNLCVNARDAMPDGGKLTVETANAALDDAYAAAHHDVIAGQYVLLCVTDTGIGIAPEILEKVFDPFFTTKPVGRGTGLGLSQVYGFIKQSGGHIKIYSEVGHGTTVRIYLPRYFGPRVTRGVTSIVAVETPRGRASEVILVVEDEAGVRNLTVDALRELGYTVIHADGPLAALEMIRDEPGIDLLFTDVIMPQMNGRELADKSLALRPDLKVLYTTGYSRNAVVHNGVLDPGLAFLNKPFTLEGMAAKVRQVLDG